MSHPVTLIDGPKRGHAPKPGMFKARCNVKRPVTLDQLPKDVLVLVDADVTTPGRIKSYWHPKIHANVIDVGCGFETEDRTAFEQHMSETHGRVIGRWAASKGANQDLIRRAQGKWRGPRLKAEGQPLKPRDTAVRLLTCERCGLAAEVATSASELWWREHTERCVGTQVVEVGPAEDEQEGAA